VKTAPTNIANRQFFAKGSISSRSVFAQSQTPVLLIQCGELLENTKIILEWFLKIYPRYSRAFINSFIQRNSVLKGLSSEN
jgi:hypothetical protein